MSGDLIQFLVSAAILLPLAGTVILLAFGKRLGEPLAGWLATATAGLAFVGAIILEYAAGIAGGCTSGLAISGGMLLAPAAFVFIAGMFIGGIPTAMLIYRNRF